MSTPSSPTSPTKAKGKDDEKPDQASNNDIIDMDVFSQILDMDDDDEADDEGAEPFSKTMVDDFSVQAEKAFEDMEKALAEKDLPKLSSLGHFLKGSSAALGIIKVQACCEKMQHYGNLRDEEAGEGLSEPVALERISKLIEECKKNYEEAQGWFRRLYEEDKVGA